MREARAVSDENARTGNRTSRFPKRRVLIVDDDPTFALLATETLERYGFKVGVAATAHDAITAFTELNPDLVLLDVDLPGGNGFDVCRTIRAGQLNSDVPVVVVTGHDDTASVDKAYEAGATDFIHKPVLWPTLPHRVDFMLRALDDRRGLALSEKRNRALLQALPDASVIVDQRGYIADHLTGSDAADEPSFVGKPLEDVFPVELAAAARRAIIEGSSSAPTTHEFAVVRENKRRWFEARFRAQADGSLLIVARDTTERRKAKARIEYLAYYDVLTRLPNRQLFSLEASQAIKEAKRDGTLLALLHLDLDRFKRVNDNLGHSVGDALLKNVARRLERLVQRSDAPPASAEPAAVPVTVARLGGDEFVVLIKGMTSDRQAIDIADRIRTLLAEPFDCGGHHLVVTPSIGIALYPRDSSDIADLLVKADMAMYLAKDQGRNVHAFFGQSMAVRSLGRLAIETDMRRAFERGDFHIAYQPKLDLASGTITGVEALLRWNHAEQGMVSPEKFIPVAEETGLIVPLGEWVIGQVCGQLSRWSAMGFPQLTAAVNVSVQQFVRRDFVDSVLRALRDAGVVPNKLELEITESLLMRNIGDTAASMNRFRSCGIALSIDDFGTGYSSLGYLRQLPVSALKIDRSFVKDLDRSEDAATICAAIIALARELRIKVVAEGVENSEQLAFLRHHHCDQAQGFLISKPVPAADLELLLRNGYDGPLQIPERRRDTEDREGAAEKRNAGSLRPAKAAT
jgi:diguanylate cyclase (GGDEF)-like protein